MGLPLILISSVYLDYVVLSSILACWVGLYFLQIIRLDRREFVLAIAAIALGIALNLFEEFYLSRAAPVCSGVVFCSRKPNYGLALTTGVGVFLHYSWHPSPRSTASPDFSSLGRCTTKFLF